LLKHVCTKCGLPCAIVLDCGPLDAEEPTPVLSRCCREPVKPIERRAFAEAGAQGFFQVRGH